MYADSNTLSPKRGSIVKESETRNLRKHKADNSEIIKSFMINFRRFRKMQCK